MSQNSNKIQDVMSVWHAFALQQQVPVSDTFAGIVSTVVPMRICLHTRIKLYGPEASGPVVNLLFSLLLTKRTNRPIINKFLELYEMKAWTTTWMDWCLDVISIKYVIGVNRAKNLAKLDGVATCESMEDEDQEMWSTLMMQQTDMCHNPNKQTWHRSFC